MDSLALIIRTIRLHYLGGLLDLASHPGSVRN
jgi:hypothetical protein